MKSSSEVKTHPASRRALIVFGAWGALLVASPGWIAGAWHKNADLEPISIGGPFSLIDQDGRRFTDAALKGKPTLLYFGYTYCPDICPTSLLLMETAVESLGKNAPNEVNIVFITIDPERDTPALLKNFVSNFGPKIVGATGTPDQIASVARAYKVYYQKVPSRDDAPYLMDHSSVIYLLDRDGRSVGLFTHDSSAEEISEQLRRLS